MGLVGPVFQVLRTVGNEVSLLGWQPYLPSPSNLCMSDPTSSVESSSRTLLRSSACTASENTTNRGSARERRDQAGGAGEEGTVLSLLFHDSGFGLWYICLFMALSYFIGELSSSYPRLGIFLLKR